ncbi:MAG: hypothetical protein ABIT76_07235 [Chthoniobacterales bacterium]
MNPTLSNLEQEQILQTIEMFELITQSNPDDYQSYDILKDAYLKVGRDDDAYQISRKLGETYISMGQYSSALLEFEALLQRHPADKEILAKKKDVEERMSQGGNARNPVDSLLTEKVINGASVSSARQGSVAEPSLIEVRDTQRNESALRQAGAVAEDGDTALSKFLIYHGICPNKAAKVALERIRERNEGRAPGTLPFSLLEEVCNETQIPIDTLYCDLLDKVKLAYIPLEIYDIDRSIVKMLPEEITIGRLVLPFDLMSRTLMIATCNPFDVAAKSAAQKMLDYNIQWYVATPAAIAKALTDVYKLDKPDRGNR